ncbi:VOC family protein [uncultured Aeromicrobium sp.]|uniref:VOC family protein n=1 Tax=uncultured Aeromicrobium sp. TaxID=337820 RepID=UPI0025E15441|nr:VOC family protein [uncultured Aeromicrobium sp.]
MSGSSRPGPITTVASVTIRTPDPVGHARLAAAILGAPLAVSAQPSSAGDLVAPVPELEYIEAATPGLDHVSLLASDAGALRGLRRKLHWAGLRTETVGSAGAGSDDFAFTGPQDIQWYVLAPETAGVASSRLGHVNLQVPEPNALAAFLTETLGMRTAAHLRGGRDAVFLSFAGEQQSIAIFAGDRPALHHHAWEALSAESLLTAADTDPRYLWGPVHHGPGDRLAVYFREPAGAVIESFIDLEAAPTSTDLRPRAELVKRARRGADIPAGFLDRVIPALPPQVAP